MVAQPVVLPADGAAAAVPARVALHRSNIGHACPLRQNFCWVIGGQKEPKMKKYAQYFLFSDHFLHGCQATRPRVLQAP